MKTINKIIETCLVLLFSISCTEQGPKWDDSIYNDEIEDFHTLQGKVDFSHTLREWDGFGVNYVQTAHTKNYNEWPQEYGGFSLLSEVDRDKVVEMIFGEDGLKPGIVKMFLDPLHQSDPGGEYDHLKTTSWMLDFVERGLKITREANRDLQVITTLYCPPAYMTLQKELRGRDMDPDHKDDLAMYMIHWAKFLQDRNIPIRHISLHNEGEDWRRWPADGQYSDFDLGHDYNMYWRPGQVAEFIATMPTLMKKAGLKNVGITNGEPSRFYQFQYSGYAKAILENKAALKNLSIVTSHNFYRPLSGHRWFSGTSNVGTNMLRQKRPELKAWVTSASWGQMNTDFVWQLYMNIYLAEVNAYIPWAVIQRPAEWSGGDPNPGTAFRVNEDRSWEVLPGYYWYKQVSRAGQPGMAVVYTECMDSEIQLIGFASNKTNNKDNFIIINSGNNVTYRADAIDLNINGERFHFSTKDPNWNRNREGKYKNVLYEITSTGTGYLAEFAIPWDAFNGSPLQEQVPFNLEVKNGEHSLESSITWKENGFILPGGKINTDKDHLVAIRKVGLPVKFDGELSKSWEGVEEVAFNTFNHPNIIPWFKGNWKALYDNKYIYLAISVNDETNLMGARNLTVELNGTEAKKFDAYRTSEKGELYEYLGEYEIVDGCLNYVTPSKSITTFFGK